MTLGLWYGNSLRSTSSGRNSWKGNNPGAYKNPARKYRCVRRKREFHTFTFKGPIFKNEIKYKTGEKVFKKYNAPVNLNDPSAESTDKVLSGFWCCDLLST
ncbi:hypothetical protein IDJ75_06295 [Mucilaginibacter rigui]|uniref:Uncharacterized protein n=1 Tax=Mucilaginibacter rigui TaxID=534635 RepID=A0ABR7X2S2_9SPHI|nr:hypothetical protein [Mucilaginibacter rigui]MBD1384881.1 hypothetical protein [Mucilaginibacter rigui]